MMAKAKCGYAQSTQRTVAVLNSKASIEHFRSLTDDVYLLELAPVAILTIDVIAGAAVSVQAAARPGH